MIKALSRSPWLLLAPILFIALGLRLWGIHFGLPYEYHVDEVQYVRQAASMGSRGLEPVWWNNPPLYKYIYLVEYGLLFAVGRVLGWYQSVGDFAAQSTVDPTRLYLVSRATTALLGAATVYATYKLGKNGYGRLVGLAAAWFLAVAFLHVRDSHFATNDIPVTLLVTLALFAAFKIIDTGARRWYIAAGVTIGLAFATKYSGALVALPVLIAHFFAPDVRFRRLRSWHFTELLILAAAAVGAAIVASPYFVITPGDVIRDAYEALYVAGREGFDGWQIDPAGGFVYYLKSLAWGLGWLLLGLAMLGVCFVFWRRSPKSWVLLSFVFLTYLLFGRQQMYFARFILPIVPCLLILAAVVLEQAAHALARRLVPQRNAAPALLAAAALLVTIQPLLSSLRFGYVLAQTDTRSQAKVWLEANIPAGSKIAVDWPFYGPPLATAEQTVANAQNVYVVTAVGGAGLSEHPLAWYREQGFDYLITSSFITNIPLLDSARDSERRAFYTALDEEFTPIQVFAPAPNTVAIPFIFEEVTGPAVSLWERTRPGPVLTIYALE